MKDSSLRRRLFGRPVTPDPDGLDVAQLVAALTDRLGRRLYVAVIPNRWTDDQAKRLTRVTDWILDGDDVRLTAIERAIDIQEWQRIDRGGR